MQQQQSQLPLTIIRIVAAALVCIHGWHRIIEGNPAGLGRAVTDSVPLAFALGWGVTLLEAVGALVFAAGRLVVPLSLSYVAVYTVAILVYHLRHGWFTAGTKADGCEYAVLLIAAFLSVGLAHLPPGLARRVGLPGPNAALPNGHKT